MISSGTTITAKISQGITWPAYSLASPPRPRQGPADESGALDGELLRPRVGLLPDRSVPGLRAARRGLGRRGDVLHRLRPVHGGRRAAELVGLVGPARTRRSR